MSGSSQVCACSISVLHFDCLLIMAVVVASRPVLCVSDVPYFRDLSFDVMGLFMSPYMLAAQAAQNLGLDQLAVQYAHEALSFHKNPVKTYYTHVKLGEILREERRSESESENVLGCRKQWII